MVKGRHLTQALYCTLSPRDLADQFYLVGLGGGDWERPRLLVEWYFIFHKEQRLRRRREMKLALLNNLRRREAAERAASRRLRSWLSTTEGHGESETDGDGGHHCPEVEQPVGREETGHGGSHPGVGGGADGRNNSRKQHQARWVGGPSKRVGRGESHLVVVVVVATL